MAEIAGGFRACPSSSTATPFAGRGVVAEDAQLSVSGYRTRGTVHVVINSQLRFTTAPASALSVPTDVAKMVQAPIFHVNGDDPEACVRAARLAFVFRQTFHKDVVIDLVCYRKHGHNEGDDPSYTQPLMYQRIEAKRSVRELYTESLVCRCDMPLAEGRVTLGRLQRASRSSSTRCGASPLMPRPSCRCPTGTGRRAVRRDRRVSPAGGAAGPSSVVRSVPDGFIIHPKLGASSSSDELVASGQIDWALAGGPRHPARSCTRGVRVRPHGPGHPSQDFQPPPLGSGRLLQRRGYVPLAHIATGLHRIGADALEPAGEMGNFTVRDSSLSEYAAVGFECRYSVEAPGGARGLGGAVRASQRRPDHHRQLLGRGGEQMGAVQRVSSCCCRTGTRARGPSTRRRAERFLSYQLGNRRVTVPPRPRGTSICCAHGRMTRSARSSW